MLYLLTAAVVIIWLPETLKAKLATSAHIHTHIHTYASMSCRTGRSENSSSSESSRASEEDTDCSTQQSGVIPEEQNDPQNESIDRVSKPDDICSLQDSTTATSSEKTSNTTWSTGLYYSIFITLASV